MLQTSAFYSGSVSYGGTGKLKKWLTDDNYVKNIVLKELQTSITRERDLKQ